MTSRKPCLAIWLKCLFWFRWEAIEGWVFRLSVTENRIHSSFWGHGPSFADQHWNLLCNWLPYISNCGKPIWYDWSNYVGEIWYDGNMGTIYTLLKRHRKNRFGKNNVLPQIRKKDNFDIFKMSCQIPHWTSISHWRTEENQEPSFISWFNFLRETTLQCELASELCRCLRVMKMKLKIGYRLPAWPPANWGRHSCYAGRLADTRHRGVTW